VFIITHQSYELWFKQIIFELESIIDIFDDPLVQETKMATVLHRLNRVKTIQWVLIQQIDVIKTITPMDFLEFRDLLVPASGFQSIQFKQIEIMLGIKRKFRIAADQEFFCTRLSKSDKAELDKLEENPSILELTDDWLRKMPFLEFDDFHFWQAYEEAVEKMLASDEKIITENVTLTDREKQFQLNDLTATRTRFQSVFDETKFNELRQQGEFRLSHQAFLSALFVHLYRDEPMIHSPFRYLSLLLDIDELFTNWRQKHANVGHQNWHRRIVRARLFGRDHEAKSRLYRFVQPVDVFDPSRGLARTAGGITPRVGLLFHRARKIRNRKRVSPPKNC
jgi:tryptophan 2,3-dioxygenase